MKKSSPKKPANEIKINTEGYLMTSQMLLTPTNHN